MSAFDGSRQIRLATEMLDAAREALAAYDAMVAARVEPDQGVAPAGDHETDFRRWLGMATGHVETAGLILEGVAGRDADDPVAWGVAREATRIAHETILFMASRAPEPSEALTAAAVRALGVWSDPSGNLTDQVHRTIARERLGVED